MTDIIYTPTEARQRLSILRDRAIAAGLGDVVRGVDYRLMISAIVEIGALEMALAAAPPLAVAHADIAQQFDTPPESSPAAAIPAPRRPGIASTANPPRPAPRPASRRFMGPDAMDLEIPV